MPSPFPGMDPYLERSWRDVQTTLITLARGQLNRTLPDDLVARVEERVVIDPEGAGSPRATYPDLRVYEDPMVPAEGIPQGAGGVSVAAPIILELEVESHTEPYLTILDADGASIVTVSELLSPTNKRSGTDREEYLRKRNELAAARVNVVEIDLLRPGSGGRCCGRSSPRPGRTRHTGLSRGASIR